MGLRGPKPKPTALREMEGGRKRGPKAGRAEPAPTPAPPECPVWLVGEGRAKWDALAPELARLGLLTAVDGDRLAEYCHAWGEFLWAIEVMNGEGRVVTSVTGYKLPHPAVAICRDAKATLLRLGACFGLDPSARARLSIGSGPAEADPLGDFLGER